MTDPRLPLRIAFLSLCAMGGVAGCTVVSSVDNAKVATDVVARQERSIAPWRRDAAAEADAVERIRALLRDGVSAQDSVAVCFLAHPDVQLAFEALEISRSELVSAVTLPNPIAILGTRTPGGNLSAFYPDRNFTVGVLQNVLGLVNIPSRKRIAKRELERARLETADRLIALAAEVNEAWLAYAAARRVHELRENGVQLARGTLEALRQQLEPGAEADVILAQERVAVTQTEGSALRSALDVQTTRARLAQAMGIAGRFDDWEVTAGLPGLPATDPNPRALELSALDHRLDLQAARISVESRLDAAGVQARWRWLGATELGVFRESASGGTHFTGPNAMLELPLFDQRQSQILAANSESRAAARRLESQLLNARAEIRTHAAELATTRQLVTQYDQDLVPALRRLEELPGRESIEGRRAAAASLGIDEERVGLVRDYWRARAALARAAGAWEALPEWPMATQSGAVTR
ncbi:MAG: TolC family protein [Steroidobacteraceae bacterium]